MKEYYIKKIAKNDKICKKIVDNKNQSIIIVSERRRNEERKGNRDCKKIKSR